MVGKKTFFSVMIFFLLVSSVHAVSLQDIGLYFNEAPVTHLRPNDQLNVDFGVFVADFPLECEPRGVTRCDLLASINGDEQRLRTNACEEREGRYWCPIPYTLSTQGINEEVQSITTTYHLSFDQGLNRLAQTQGEFVTTIDRTNPQLVKLETGFCQGGTCFVGSNAEVTVRAEFEDDMTAFYQRLVRFEIGSSARHALECGSNWCETTVTTHSCTHGSPVRVRLVDFAEDTMPSMEDARNPVQNLFEINARCDAEPPVIEQLQLRSRGNVPTVFETAQPIEVTARVTDMSGGQVELYVQSDTLSQDDEIIISCTEGNTGEYTCNDEIINLNAGEHDVTFVFIDGAGNRAEDMRPVRVEETGPADIEPDFFEAQVTGVTPNQMNKVALQLAIANTVNYPLIVDYRVTAKQSDVQVVTQSIQELECYWSDMPLLDDLSGAISAPFSIPRSYILSPEQGVGDNRFYFNFRAQAQELPNRMYVQCTFDLYVVEDNIFYPNPERETINFEINFFNSVLGTPGEAFIEEIKKAEDDIENFLGIGKILLQLQKYGGMADNVCSVLGLLSTAEAVGGSLEALGQIPFVGWIVGPIGTAIHQPTHKILSVFSDPNRGDDDTVDAMRTMTGEESRSFYLSDLCESWMCSKASEVSGWAGDICWGANEGVFSNDDGTLDTVTGGNACMPSYKDSLFASLGVYGGGFCGKGVLYNLGKWQAVDCGYVACLKEQSTYGANINVCKQAKTYKTCAYVFDEFSQIPYVNVVPRTAALINERVQNAPLELLISTSSAFCSPSDEIFQTVKDEFLKRLVDTGLSMATAGTWDLLKQVAAWTGNIDRLQQMMPATAQAEPQGQPGNANLAYAICHISRAIWHITDFQQMRSGASALSMPVGANEQICSAALCNGPDCDRSRAVQGLFGGLNDVYLALISQQRAAQDYNPQLQRQLSATSGFFSEGLAGLADQEIRQKLAGESGDAGAVSNREVRQATNALNEFRKGRADGSIGAQEDNNWNDFFRSKNIPDEQLLGVLHFTNPDNRLDLNDVKVTVDGTQAIFTVAQDGNVLTTPVDLPSARDAKLLREHLQKTCSDGGCTTVQNLEFIQKLQACEGNCQELADVQDKDVSQAPLEVSQAQQLFQGINNLDNGIFDRIEQLQNKIAGRDADFNDLPEDERVAALDSDRVAIIRFCMDANPDDRSCSFGEDARILQVTCNAEATDCQPRSMNLLQDPEIDEDELKKQQAIEQLYTVAASYIAKWLFDQGYLDSLKLSNVWSWSSETTERIFSPEEWKRNFCSSDWDIMPMSQNLDFVIGSDPLEALGTGAGPILTFAAEVREIDDANNTYTVSYFIRTENHDNTVRLLLNPGNQEVTGEGELLSETSDGVELGRNQELRGAFSVESTETFNEFCISFNNGFPNPNDRRLYCRSFVESAFRR